MLTRQLVAAVASLHDCDAAHLDVGAHSVWLEAPTTVRLSHLMAAHVPGEESLGVNRYQFLSSVALPENVLELPSSAQRKDVFLVGVAAHMILLGCRPQGDPPDWNSSADEEGALENLHAWFRAVLEHDPELRPPSCSDALTMFNKATSASPSSTEIIAEIERRFTGIKSQMQVARMYPPSGDMVEETGLVESWISESDGKKILVKLWKQAAFGELKTNCGRILAFLERARSISLDMPGGVPEVLAYSWLSDAVVVASEWVEGETWQKVLDERLELEKMEPLEAFKMMERFSRTVLDLHGQNIFHGDLKPSNVIVREDGSFILIDILDLKFSVDGENSVSKYAPSSGGTQDRDRYAVLAMSMELLQSLRGNDAAVERVKSLVRELMGGSRPALLEPFIESLRHEIAGNNESGQAGKSKRDVCVSIRGAQPGAIDSDEGSFHIRHRSGRDLEFLHFRGAKEELMVALSHDWSVEWVRRQQVKRSSLIYNLKNEFMSCDLNIQVERNDINSFSSLSDLISDLNVKDHLLSRDGSAKAVAEETDSGTADVSQDVLAEEVTKESEAQEASGNLAEAAVDVPRLWRRLIEVEDQLSIEGRSTGPSFFEERLNLHSVPFELEFGQFEFDRDDKVLVEKQLRSGKWIKVGRLDVRQSQPDLIRIDAFLGRDKFNVEDESRLRFESYFSAESLKRRKDAVERVLGGSGRSASLVSALDPRSECNPSEVNHDFDESAISAYGLNGDQESALRGVISKRPLGLVQGPPGTGKTRFIAALIHYALTHGLARNVLLSSQSHEAVNTAIEGVLKHFSAEGEKPSVFRVGSLPEGSATSLRPFYADTLEQALKDEFAASFRDRVCVAAEALGIPRDFAEKIVTVETAVAEMAGSIHRLSSLRVAGETGNRQRINSLKEGLQRQLRGVLSDDVDLAGRVEFETLPAEIGTMLSREGSSIGVSEDKIERLMQIIHLGKDFIGSSATSTRSFQPFFAGTRQIVAGTCVGLGRRALGLVNTPFDLVIVDEAARCTPSELLVPLQASRWTVLVGDQAQLQPHHEAAVVEQVARDLNIRLGDVVRSDFERAFQSDYARTAGFRMREQYRMLPNINKVVSNSFYEGLNLSAGRIDPCVPEEVLSATLPKEVTWIETDEFGVNAYEKTAKGKASKLNEVESDTIVALLTQWVERPAFTRWLETQAVSDNGVGVICMYAAQRDLVRRELNKSPAGRYLDRGIKVGTVDSYQGKENPIVILSLVRNNRDGKVFDAARTIREGFLSTPNRVNVALSRAMDRLVIVGNRRSWRPGTPVARAASEFGALAAAGEATIMRAESLLLRDDAEPQKIQEGVE